MKKEYDFSRANSGPVLRAPAGKTRITIRLDSDVLDWFRERADDLDGANYQSLINQALRSYIEGEVESLEETIRRVLREELPKAKGA